MTILSPDFFVDYLGLEADASGFFPSDHAGVSVEFEGSV